MMVGRLLPSTYCRIQTRRSHASLVVGSETHDQDLRALENVSTLEVIQKSERNASNVFSEFICPLPTHPFSSPHISSSPYSTMSALAATMGEKKGLGKVSARVSPLRLAAYPAPRIRWPSPSLSLHASGLHPLRGRSDD